MKDGPCGYCRGVRLVGWSGAGPILCPRCCERDEDVFSVVTQAWREQRTRVVELEAELAALRESARWVPVGERLPMDLLPRIVVDESGYVFPSRVVLPYGAGKWLDFDGESVTTRVTHWMDMPAPPEPQAVPEVPNA